MKYLTHRMQFTAPAAHDAMHLLADGGAGEIVGCLQLHEWQSPNVGMAWVHVAPEHRRKGVARGMVREAVRLCGEAGKESITLSVVKGHEAEALYRSEGFRQYHADEKLNYLVRFL